MSKRIRCAIYTRKSTEEGLEQDFNSLQAQREACEAYIRSQRELGWMALATRYDDGGISGGTMDRPALQMLLVDIESRKVDLVVVYKVDRLTRSLTDFAKMVELFDARGISFVSVTQQFNTTTSMGRLTLNVLLSFAQFEREVTGERIRDKIAASKKKGMWMGGLPALGYDVRDRKLIINAAEADTVRLLFRLYLEWGTVKGLIGETIRRKLVTKHRIDRHGRETGGQIFTRGHLYQLLSNPIYVGEIRHKGMLYPGQHQALVDRDTFEAVRRQLQDNAKERRTAKNAHIPSLLTGLIYDETGDRLCPTHASKQGRRYHYYISQRLMHRMDEAREGWRLPAGQLERVVQDVIGDFLRNQVRLTDALGLHGASLEHLRVVLGSASMAADDIGNQALLRRLVHKATLSPETIRIDLRHAQLRTLLQMEGTIEPSQTEKIITISAPLQLMRRGVGAKLILGGMTEGTTGLDGRLIAVLAQAHRWFDHLRDGSLLSIDDIARREGIDAGDISRIIALAFLAPDIVQSIIEGRQPVELTTKGLKRMGALPQAWDQQRKLLGFRTRAPA